MRELIANLICVLTLCLAIGLSFLFALRHNPAAPETTAPAVTTPVATTPQTTAATSTQTSISSPPPATPVPVLSPELATRARDLFKSHRCTICHSIAGEGNPRYPLDAVGSRRTPEELPDWITGSGSAAGELSPAIIRRKEQYKTLPEPDLATLINWLSSLK